MQKIYNAGFDFGNNPTAYFRIAELVFCLRFKNGGFELDRNRTGKTFAHIKARIVFFQKFIYALEYSFAKSREMGAAVAGELPIYKGKIGFAVIWSMRKGKFQKLGFVMTDRICGAVAYFVGQKIKQAVF